MLLPLPKRHRNPEDNVLPLINIVFLLLIFFMLAGALVQEPPFSVTPPETRHTESGEPDQKYLAIAADGRLAYGGDIIEESELGARLAERAENGAPLQVRADNELEVDRLTRLLGALREADIAEIRLLTTSQL